MTAVQNSNGSVSLPMWIMGSNGTFTRYTGSATTTVMALILNSATVSGDNINPIVTRGFTQITFSNGSASAAWSAGIDIDDDDD